MCVSLQGLSAAALCRRGGNDPQDVTRQRAKMCKEMSSVPFVPIAGTQCSLRQCQPTGGQDFKLSILERRLWQTGGWSQLIAV